jgi:hypothetical protein
MVEARMLAHAEKHKQLFDLLDAFESLPGYMDNWNDKQLDIIKFNINIYRNNYPSESFNYEQYLLADDVPQRF